MRRRAPPVPPRHVRRLLAGVDARVDQRPDVVRPRRGGPERRAGHVGPRHVDVDEQSRRQSRASRRGVT